jgi:hypothetical protein
MFKLIAILFAVVNGQPADEIGHMRNKVVFPTEEACMNFFDTTDGVEAKQELDKFIASNEGRVTVKFSCEKEPEKETL